MDKFEDLPKRNADTFPENMEAEYNKRCKAERNAIEKSFVSSLYQLTLIPNPTWQLQHTWQCHAHRYRLHFALQAL